MTPCFFKLVTTNANIYQAWQVRVMHFWYNKMKKQCEAEDPDGCQMGGFTRVLHDKADKLVDEIPTCVVDRCVSFHLVWCIFSSLTTDGVFCSQAG
jgi:hypothetical protein